MEHWNIYTDESRQSADRYMITGGLALSHSATQDFSAELESFRHAFLMFNEFKWTKVSRAKLGHYQTLMDIFFRRMLAGQVCFHCMIVDKHILDFQTHHAGDRDRAFSVLYYNLLLHAFARRYGFNYKLRAYLDYNDSKTSQDKLKEILNWGFDARYRPFTHPFDKLHRVDSKKFDLIQVADVILGAIGWHKNDRHKKTESSRPKSALADHIAALAGRETLATETPFEQCDFTIWQWTPRGKPAGLGG